MPWVRIRPRPGGESQTTSPRAARAERREIGDGVHPTGPAAQISLALFPSQQEFGEDRHLLLAGSKPFIGMVPVAGHPAAAKDLRHHPALPQALERPTDRVFIHRHQRIAVALLV